MASLLILLAVFVHSLVAAVGSESFAACQFPTKNPLAGCPEGTIFVSPTDPSANFTTVGEALSSISAAVTSQVILIGAGQYLENVTVYNHIPITLLGQTRFPPSFSSNLVEIQNSLAVIAIPGQSNINTSTLAVDGPPTLLVRNLNLTNAWPSTNHSQALAVGVNSGNASFHTTSFKSFQDTLYVGSKANAYFLDSEIRGQTDFLFGQGRAWFEGATIGIRNTGDIPLAGIIAWQGTENTTKGAYVHRSRIGLAPDHNTTHDLTGTMALGRPWNNQSVTIYIETYMGSVVNASGFTAWAGKVFDNVTYGEYGSFGPGYVPSQRLLDQETLGSATEGNAKYNLASVFGEIPSWL